MHRRLALGLVALLAVTAGCNVIAPTGGDGDGRDSTVTPVQIPDETGSEPGRTPPATTATGSAAPDFSAFPGVTAAGLSDRVALFESHERYLSNRSYTFDRSRGAEGGSGSVATSYAMRAAVENETTYLHRETGARLRGEVTTYTDPSGGYERAEAPNGSTVVTTGWRELPRPRRHFADVTADVGEIALDGSQFSAEVVERDGRRYARLFSDTPPEYVNFVYGERAVSNFSATIWVAPEGYVRTLHYRFDVADETGDVAVDLHYSYGRVGETTVDEPSWVAAAKRNRTITGPAGASRPTITSTATGPTTDRAGEVGSPSGPDGRRAASDTADRSAVDSPYRRDG